MFCHPIMLLVPCTVPLFTFLIYFLVHREDGALEAMRVLAFPRSRLGRVPEPRAHYGAS